MAGEDVVELAKWKARRGDSEAGAMSSPLARLARGERGAVSDCVETYGPMVRALSRRLLPGDQDVDDAVQEVFVELWRSAQRFDPARASDRGFVAMITRRRVIDRRRRSERRPTTVAMTPERDRASDEHERILGKVSAGPALKALATLAEDRRTWILMSVVEGFSHGEIAEQTKTPLGTVKSGIRRGMAEMRNWLEQRQGMQEVGP